MTHHFHCPKCEWPIALPPNGEVMDGKAFSTANGQVFLVNADEEWVHTEIWLTNTGGRKAMLIIYGEPDEPK